MNQREFANEAKRLRPTLLNIARQYIIDADDANDVAQDALLRLWQICPQLITPIDALAATITRNLARDFARRKRLSFDISSIDLPQQPDNNDFDDRLEHILKIIDKMPTLQQTILRLRHMEGMEYSEIAQLIGCSESSIRQTISRTRRRIKDIYLKEEQL